MRRRKKIQRSLENPAVSLNDPRAYDLFVQQAASGIPVSYHAVMGHPAIRKAVTLIAGYVAKTPRPVFTKKSNGREKDESHPAHVLLNRKPSRLYTPFHWAYQLTAYRLVYDNAYSYIIRDAYGTPTEFLILNPQSTWVDTTTGEPIYKTTINGTIYGLPAEDVFHWRDFGGDGLVGDELIQIARDALGLSLALQQYAATYFKNNCAGRIYIELPPVVKDNQKLQQFVKEWMAAYGGLVNAHKDRFVPSGSKVNETGANAEDAQLVQSREADIIAVSQLFNIPPHKLGARVQTSYSSLEVESQAFLSDCLDPLFCSFEQEAEAKLLTEYEKRTGSRYIEFDRESLLTPDSKTKIELLVTELNNGLLSWEEARQKLNLPTDRDEKQEWRRPANIAVAGEDPPQQQPPQQPEPQQQPQQEPQPQRSDAGIVDNVNNNPDERAKTLTRQALSRLLNRVRKSVEGGKLTLTDHREIFVDHLGVWPNAERFTDKLLNRMQEEIANVLPEQYEQVWQRYSADQLSEELWN